MFPLRRSGIGGVPGVLGHRSGSLPGTVIPGPGNPYAMRQPKQKEERRNGGGRREGKREMERKKERQRERKEASKQAKKERTKGRGRKREKDKVRG